MKLNPKTRQRRNLKAKHLESSLPPNQQTAPEHTSRSGFRFTGSLQSAEVAEQIRHLLFGKAFNQAFRHQ